MSFKVGFEKVADLIPANVFKKMPDYGRRRLLEAKEAIQVATNPDTKLSQNVREKMIEAALDQVKGSAYNIATAATTKDSVKSNDTVTPGPAVEKSAPTKL